MIFPMAVDEMTARAKSATVTTRQSSITIHEKSKTNPDVSARSGHLLARKHRIERWVYKGRSASISDTATTTSAALGTVSAQKRSESSYSQANRVLNIRLIQLSEQRQKVIEQNNFDQKLFANKQALKYKDNQSILRTLSYVRKCCKYVDAKDDEKDQIDPRIFLEEKPTTKRSRSRSPSTASPTLKRNLSANRRTQTSTSMAETFIQHNKKHLGSYASSPISRKLTESKTTTSSTPTISNPSATPVDDDPQKRHVQFQINSDRQRLTCQSAHAIGKSNSHETDQTSIPNPPIAQQTRSSSVPYPTRSANSAPLIRTRTSISESTNNLRKQSPSPRRSLSRIYSAKNSVHEFRLHPERFLSASNRYLPLLHRQALEVESRELSLKQQKEKSESIKKRRMNYSPPISRLSDGSDLTYDDAKSFLSEEYDTGKLTPQLQTPVWLEQVRKTNKKLRIPKKINMMEAVDDEEAIERRQAIAQLRDREYAHLHQLIHSNGIEHILEPFSAIKTEEINPVNSEQQKRLNYKRQSVPSLTEQSAVKPSRIRQLSDILHSIDSLRCSDTMDRRARRQVDIEKNRAKLGILIF